MSISTYFDLKEKVQSFAKRSDILSVLDDFISLTENDIWEVLRAREMETRAQASTPSASRFMDLPDGFIKMRRLKIQVDSRWLDMGSKDLKAMRILPVTGLPYEYAISEDIELNRVPDQAYPLEMQYFKSSDPLSSENPTNEILTHYPMIYLSGCMIRFGQWSMQPDVSEYWQVKFDSEVARANRKGRQGRYGPAPTISMPGMIV